MVTACKAGDAIGHTVKKTYLILRVRKYVPKYQNLFFCLV